MVKGRTNWSAPSFDIFYAVFFLYNDYSVLVFVVFYINGKLITLAELYIELVELVVFELESSLLIFILLPLLSILFLYSFSL